MIVRLVRTEKLENATFGHLLFSFEHCYTLELPWRDNKKNISCIPEGKYKCKLEDHKTKGRVYRLFDVPNRDGILIHVGNYAGKDSRGCILVGDRVMFPDAVHESRIALDKLVRIMGDEFDLVIE